MIIIKLQFNYELWTFEITHKYEWLGNIGKLSQGVLSDFIEALYQ